ncbi:MAG: 2-amino-4-hydroxy-6-hydroxymethyldihydropteridine diphosphokinase [Myxococcota bacterium]
MSAPVSSRRIAPTRAEVALALGSSLGDRAEALRLALSALEVTPGLRVVRVSRVLATAPAGGVARGVFLNAVVRGVAALSPAELLATCKRIERLLRRRPARRWADRVVDVDVLLYDRAVIAEPDLRVPHPRLAERDFLLQALAEVWPDAPNPWTGEPWLRARRLAPVVGTLPQP